MKSSLGIVGLVLLLISCKRENVSQKEIDRLSTDWDRAFTAVNQLIDQLEEEQYTWEEKMDDIRRLETQQELPADSLRQQLVPLLEEYRQQGEALNTLNREVEAFAIRFDTQTSQLEELETQIAEGRNVEDLPQKIARFRDVADQLSVQVEGWQKRLSTTRNQSRAIYQEYVRLTTPAPES